MVSHLFFYQFALIALVWLFCLLLLRLSRFMPLSPLVPWGTEVYSTFTVILDSLDSAGTSR